MKTLKRVIVEHGPADCVVVDVRTYDDQNFQIRINDVLVTSSTSETAAIDVFRNVLLGLTK